MASVLSNGVSRTGLALLALATTVCLAQFNSSIEGTVTDPTGAGVPDVTIRAVNELTGVTSTT